MANYTNFIDPTRSGKLIDAQGNVIDLRQNGQGNWGLPSNVMTFGGDLGAPIESAPPSPTNPADPAGLVNTSPAGGTPWNVDAAGNQYDSQGNLIGPTTPGSISGSYQPPAPMADDGFTWGGPVSAFQGAELPPSFTPPPLPDALSRPFELPTAQSLLSTPGYMARYQMGLDARQRMAAARGTLLSGGTQKALTRYGQDYASNEYDNAVRQALAARGQQASDYLNLTYGPAWQTNNAAIGRYGTLYGQYQDLINNNRNAMNDYWNQQRDLLEAGLRAGTAGNPGTGSQV